MKGKEQAREERVSRECGGGKESAADKQWKSRVTDIEQATYTRMRSITHPMGRGEMTDWDSFG